MAILAISSVSFAFPITRDFGDDVRFTGAPGKPGFGFLGWDSDDRRALRAHPTPLFSTFVENKGRTAIQPKGDPCVTLGWPLGGPSVAQGPSNPNPSPNPNRQRVVNGQALSTKYQVPS